MVLHRLHLHRRIDERTHSPGGRRHPRRRASSRPEQVHDNVKAAGVQLPAEVMPRIDEALGDVVERDPAKTARG